MQTDPLKQETLAQKLITKWFRAYLFVIFLAPLWYLLRLLASNTLTVADVGIFYWVLSLISLLYSYNDLGLTESMQYFLPKFWIEGKKWQIKNTIWLSFFMQLITGIIIFLLLYCNADWLAINHFHAIEAAQVIKIMSFYFLGYNMIQVCNAVFVAFQDTFCSGLMNVCNTFSALIFAIIFWLSASFSVSLFALAWIIWVAIWISVWISLLIKKYYYLLEEKRDSIDKELISTQFKYAFWVFLTTNVSTLLSNVDQQLVLNKLWAESSWYFTNMLSLLNIFLALVWPFLALLFPVATELSTRKEKEKFRLLESTMYTHFAFLAIVVWWIFLIFWQEIAVIFYWEKFRFSWELLQILWPLLIFNCLNSLNFYLLAWLWKIKQRFSILLLSLIFNVICNVLVLYVFNMDLHAVISVLALSWVVSFVGWLIIITKEYPFTFDWKFFWKNLLLIAILCLLFRWIRNTFNLFVNSGRVQTLFILAWICLFYAWIIAILNWWKLKFLRWEVKKIKKSEN